MPKHFLKQEFTMLTKRFKSQRITKIKLYVKDQALASNMKDMYMDDHQFAADKITL